MSTEAVARPQRWWEGDLAYDFLHSPFAIVAAVVTIALIAVALGANIIAPFDVNDPASANVIDARLPPGSSGMFGGYFLLGTDPQGRDMLSAVIFGLRTSLLVGGSSVVLAALVGILLGLISGYVGGWIDALIMRIADVQLSFPAILVALMIDGVSRTVMARATHDALAVPVLVIAIAATYWVQYARTVRGSVMVEKNKDYVAAAQLMGLPAPVIMLRHVLPNAMGPVLIIATINLALAIITEATLSFLGVGLPDTMPSLGTLIRIGNNYLFSGEWWIVAFPGFALAALILSINLLGDWLRDALNPKLR